MRRFLASRAVGPVIRPCQILGLLLLLGCAPSGQGESRFQSREYAIRGVESPVTGPAGTEKHLLVKNHPAELIWLTSFSCAGVVDGHGQPLPLRLFSQANVDLMDVRRHLDLMGTKALPNGRIFSLGEGVVRIELPVGFGVPVMSSEPLLVTTSLLNLDPYTPETAASVVTNFSFVYQNGLSRPMVPLRVASAYALVSLEKTSVTYGVPETRPLLHGEGCAMLPPATDQVFQDPAKRRFAADWLVAPGETTTRTLVTRLIGLPYDTTLHYASAQLLPHAQRIELRDRSEMKALVTLEVEERNRDTTLASVPVFTSAEGVEMLADHEYELVVTYRNPGKAPIPAKAAMHLYFRDKEFSPSGIGT